MLAGLVARVKKLRTKLMVGDLRGTEVVFVVVGDELLWRERGLACFIGMRVLESLQSGDDVLLFF
jgi:hypothetical protein